MKLHNQIRHMTRIFVAILIAITSNFEYAAEAIETETNALIGNSVWRVYLDASGEIELDANVDGEPDRFGHQYAADQAAKAYLQANGAGEAFTGLAGVAMFRHTVKGRTVFIPDGSEPPVDPPGHVEAAAPTPGAAEIRLIDKTPDDFWTQLYQLATEGPVNVFIPDGATIDWKMGTLPSSPHRLWIGCANGFASIRSDKQFVGYQNTNRPRGPFVVVNLDIQPAMVGAGYAGFRLFGVHGFTLYNCTVANYGATNIVLSKNVRDVLIERCRILDARSVQSYKQGLFAGAVDGLTIRDCVFDRNGTLDADGNRTTFARLLRAHNIYLSPSSKNVVIERVLSTRAAGLGLKCQSEDFRIIDCIFAYNPIGMACGLDPSKTVSRGAVGTVDGVVVIDGTDYEESNRSIGLSFSSMKDVMVRNAVVARMRAPLHLNTEITVKVDDVEVVVPIEKWTMQDSTLRGHLLTYSNGKRYDGIAFQNNVMQHTAGLSNSREFVYFQHDVPNDSTFSGNRWFGPSSQDFVTFDNSSRREKFPAFKDRVGADDTWEKVDAADPDASIETFLDTDDIWPDVRAGRLDLPSLLVHLREGLR